MPGIWAGCEKQWHFNCFLWDLALAMDYRPTPASLWCTPSSKNNSWHLLTWAPCLHLLFFFAHHFLVFLSFSLPPPSCSALLSQLGTDGRIQQMFYLAVSFCFSLPVFSLLLLFLTFAHLFCCRMDLGLEVNEVICICPKLFAVDCFEGRTTGEKRRKLLTAGWNVKSLAKLKKISHFTLKLLFCISILDEKLLKSTTPADKNISCENAFWQAKTESARLFCMMLESENNFREWKQSLKVIIL